MHLLLLCLCGVASYALAEEPLEHITSGTSGAQHTRIYSLGSSGHLPIVPASTTLLASPYSLGGVLGGLFPGNGGFHNNQHAGAYPHNNQQGGGYPSQGGYPGGYPNNNNFPGQQQQQGGSSCRYWCRSPTNQYYCCEGQNQQNGGGGGGGNVGTKPGLCPPVRPSCPPTKLFGPPQQCSNDYSCSGRDKCCFDTCLQHHTCKPTQGGGYGR